MGHSPAPAAPELHLRHCSHRISAIKDIEDFSSQQGKPREAVAGLSVTVPTCMGARPRSSSTRRPQRGARTGPRCSDPGPDGEKGGREGTGGTAQAWSCWLRGAGCGMWGAQGTLPLPAHPARFPCSLSASQCPHLAVPPPCPAQPQRQQPGSLRQEFLWAHRAVSGSSPGRTEPASVFESASTRCTQGEDATLHCPAHKLRAQLTR